MDASGYSIIFVCLLLQGLSSQPMVEEADVNKDQVEDEGTPAPTTISPPVAKNCTTAKGVFGTCITRQYCDYSTSAIDLTLYAPRGYVKPCKMEDVCCPFDSVVQANDSSRAGYNDTTAFEFDDDD